MSIVAHNSRARWLICLALALVTLAAYAPVARYPFIDLDDATYVTDNPRVEQGFSWEAIKWAFGTYHASNWHPLTWLSHMLDCQLFGLHPAGHHLTSLLFHVANVLLLFLLLQSMTGELWPSAVVALLFALHPLRVESVAWVAERKDVLSGFFFMLTLLTYGRYAALAGRHNSRSGWWYGLALLLFALGLLAKPMLVTLPCVLLLLDYWPLQRFKFLRRGQPGGGLRSLLLEKVPFLVLSLAAATFTLVAQNRAQSVLPEWAYPMDERLANVLVAYAWYLLKLFCPMNLSIYYPLLITRPLWIVAGALALLVMVTLLARRLARDEPFFAVGWCWFVVMLLPVSGLVQVGNQAYANRYSYLPHIGLFIILAWGVPRLLAGWRWAKAILLTVPLLASAACFHLTVAEVRVWKNSQTLFARAIALNPNNDVAWWLLGGAFMNQERVDQAITCLRRAAAINPGHPRVWQQLSLALRMKNEFEEAEKARRMAWVTSPENAGRYGHAGAQLFATGQREDALADSVVALNNLAWWLATDPDARLRNGEEAVRLAERACDLTQHKHAVLLGTLAAAYAEAGRFGDAVATAQQARSLALAQGQTAIAATNAQLAEWYKAGRAYHDETRREHAGDNLDQRGHLNLKN